MKPGRTDVIIVAATIAVYAAIAGPTIPAGRFAYDEADYMYAVSKGFASNYLDRPTIPFRTFVQKGREQGMKGTGRVSLSEFIRASDDIAFYRHFHAPLYYYWVGLHSKLLGTGEQAIRWASFNCLLLAFVALYFGILLVAKQSPRATAILASTMLLVSPANIATTRLITPHGLYVVTVILALVAMAKLVDTGEVRYWYYSLAAVTLAALTIEYAVLLVATLGLCAIVRRGALFAGRDRRQLAGLAGRSILLVLSIIALAWPAGLFKLTLVKNYIFFTYFAIVRGKTFGTTSASVIWLDRILAYPLESAVLIAGIVVAMVLLVRRRLDGWLLPFAVYGFLMLLTTLLNKSPELTYISSLIPPLAVIASTTVVTVLARIRPALSVALTTAIVAVLALDGVSRVRQPPSPKGEADLVVDLLARAGTTTERVAIPGVLLPTVHLYFPNVSAVVYEQTAECATLRELATSRPLDGIICRGAGQDSLQQLLEQQHDVAVDRARSDDRRRELVYYRLGKSDRR